MVPQDVGDVVGGPGPALVVSASFMAEFFENHGNLQIANRPRWRSILG